MKSLHEIHTRLQQECKALQAECLKRENEVWQCQIVHPNPSDLPQSRGNFECALAIGLLPKWCAVSCLQ